MNTYDVTFADTEPLFPPTPQRNTSMSRWDMAQLTFKMLPSAAAAITLLSLRIFMNFSHPANTLIMTGVGMTSQYFIQQIRPIANIEMHLLGDYSDHFFLTATQIIINVPHTTLGSTIVNDVLFTQFGMLTTRLFHMVLSTTPHDNRTVESTGRARGGYFMRVINGSNTIQRVAQEVLKLGVGVGLLAYGYTHPSWKILGKLGWIVTGHAIGSGFYETVHAMRIRKEKENDTLKCDSLGEDILDALPSSVRFYRKFEEVAHLVSIALPGFFLAFNRSETDCLAGVCLGITRTIDLIRFTTVPGGSIEEIYRDLREGEVYTTSQKIVRLLKSTIWPAIVIGFAIWQGYIGNQTDRIIMGSFGGAFILSYLLGRLINLAEIDSETNPILNTLFFYLHYSLAAPLLFIAITQWMLIGDIALDTYGSTKTVFATIAWVSLAWSLGTQTSEQTAGRKRKYPAPINPIGFLLSTAYTFQNLLPLFGVQPKAS